MPRRPASDRHTDSAPTRGQDAPLDGAALIEALIALHHPARRRLYEILHTGEAASVGQLAARTGLAVGSVSHHLKALHRNGFIEPAPEQARDTRESWWRGIRRRLSWEVTQWPEGTAGRTVAELAEQANLEHHTRATTAWMRTRAELPEPWRKLGYAGDNFGLATAEQVEQLISRIESVVREWDEACRADAKARPDIERRPVRVIARIFPSEPGVR